MSNSPLMPGAYPAAIDHEHARSGGTEGRCALIREDLNPVRQECERPQPRSSKVLPLQASNRMYPIYGQSTTSLSEYQHYGCDFDNSFYEANEDTSLLAANDRCIDNGTTWSSESGETVTHELPAAVYESRRRRHSGQPDRLPSPPLSHDELHLNDTQLANARYFHGGFERCIISTDRLRDVVAASNRRRGLSSRDDLRSKLQLWSDPFFDFVLILVMGGVTASIASGINFAEAFLFDLKSGHCSSGWYKTQKRCCAGLSSTSCHAWKTWSEHFQYSPDMQRILNPALFGILCVGFALLGCYITLRSRINHPPQSRLPDNSSSSTYEWERDSYLGLAGHKSRSFPSDSNIPFQPLYLAAGSGVAEIKVMMSGFLVPGFLGVRSLAMKTLALIPTVASGLSIGKEGPLIHIAASVGEVVCTIFSYLKSNINDTRRKDITSMCAACGMSLAFGTPLVGVFFTLEEFDHQFTSGTVIRALLCSAVATTTLKFLDPYGTGEALLFQVTYDSTWVYSELPFLMLLGVLAGAIGALLVKTNAFWTRILQHIDLVQKWPLAEVAVVAALTGLITFWNDHLRLPSVQLILELITPSVMSTQAAFSPSPNIPSVGFDLAVAFVLKAFLTIITLGLKVPAGVYIPSMVLGGLMGRIFGHTCQHLIIQMPNLILSAAVPITEQNLNARPGIYALIGAGATITGVTGLTATIVVVLLEFTHSAEYLIPFGLAILCAKWTSSIIESRSFYDRVIHTKRYPYLNSNVQSISEKTLTDIFQPLDREDVIELSTSSIISSKQLRRKLNLLELAGKNDGTFAIMRNTQFKGLISAADLTRALAHLSEKEETSCLLAVDSGWDIGDQHMLDHLEILDLTSFINTSPVFLDIGSSLDLVHHCFVSLGTRCICISRNGRFAGIINRKDFVTYSMENL